MRIRALLKPDWLTVLSGALIILAFPPYGLSPLIWVCLVPWLFALQRSPGKRHAAIQGVWLSWIMCVFGFPWMAFVLHEYGSIPWPVAVIMLLLYGIGGQLQFPTYAAIFKRSLQSGSTLSATSPPAPARPWFVAGLGLWLALTYAGVDWLLPKLWTDTLGHALYRAQDMRQIADLGGVFLLTFLVILVNDSVFRLAYRWLRRREPSVQPALRASAPALALSVVLIVAAMLYGSSRRQLVEARQANPAREYYVRRDSSEYRRL